MTGSHGARGGEGLGDGIILSADAVASYPGPALVVSSGRVTAANPRAARLRTLIESRDGGGIVSLLLRAATTRTSVSDTVTIEAEGGPQSLELTALPTADGAVLLLARDVTLERNLRAALVESRQRYKDLVEISSDFAWEVGADGRFSFVSPRGALGFSSETLIGRPPEELIVEPAGERVTPFHAAAAVEDAEVWMRTSGGGRACLLTSSAPLLGVDGGWRGARGICRDVTNDRIRDTALSRANNRERLLTYIVRTIRDVVDPADMLHAAAEATVKALGAGGCQIFRSEGEGRSFALAAEFGAYGEHEPVMRALATGDHFEGEIDHWRALGSISRYRQTINGAVVLWRDPSGAPWTDDDRLLIDDVANQIGLANEQISNHERIVRLSRTDSMTGLFNRRAFFEELNRRYLRLAREGKAASLIYVDLDNFKLVNDVHGHQRGDEALLAVRDLLIQNTRSVDLVARMGGDEFAVWLEGADERAAVGRGKVLLKAGKVLEDFSGRPDAPLHMSLGIAVHDPKRAETLQQLVARADEAMYEVKREGKGDWKVSRPETPEGGRGA